MTIKALTVLITGATSGFGEAAARRFVGAGHKVVVAGRRQDRLDLLQAEFGSAAHAIRLDVRDKAAVDETLSALPAGFSEVDILVNNAGLALGLGPAQDVDFDDWEVMVDTNIKGVLHCTKALLPGMIARDRGHIINLGSVAGAYPYPGGNVYCGTKAFIHQFSLALRADLLGRMIRVTSVEPGAAETEFSLVRFKGDAGKAQETYKGLQPLTAEDVAETIFYVATLPAHVNINRIEMMPTMQAFSPFSFHRES